MYSKFIGKISRIHGMKKYGNLLLNKGINTTIYEKSKKIYFLIPIILQILTVKQLK